MEIKTIHSAAKVQYGSPRVFRAMRKQSLGSSLNTVTKVMRENYIRVKLAKKFSFTTESNHTIPWLKTNWTVSSILLGPTRPGRLTSPAYTLRRDGCIWRQLKIFIR